MGRTRKVVKWTLIVFGVLSVALVALSFTSLGEETKGTKKPVALGRGAPVGDGWRLRIASVTPKADRVIAAKGSVGDAVPPRAQDFMVMLVASYVGGGKSYLLDLLTDIAVVGKHGVAYEWTPSDCGYRLPAPDLWRTVSYDGDSTVFSGDTKRGNVCFQVAKNDAASLRLFVERGVFDTRRRTWFALR